VNWFKLHKRSALICGLTLLLPALLYLKLLLGTLGVRGDYARDVARLEPRIARLQGIMAYEDQLRESAEAVQQQVSKLAFPASAGGTSVAASLQTDIRQLMSDAGLSVANSQVLPVREEEQFDYISVKLTVAGELAALDEALAELAIDSPLVLVESLDVWPTRQSRSRDTTAVQTITASIRLMSLRSVL